MDAAASEALDRALSAGEREFREIADFAPVMIWRSGPDRLCDWFNKPWLDFVGASMQGQIGYGWAAGVHRGDYERCIAIYTEAFDARRPFSMEYRLRRHDGEYRWLLDSGSPYQRDGQFAGYFGSCIDITAHREAEQRQARLIDELHHRVRNTLAIVQSIARQSLQAANVPAELHENFDARLQALSAIHDLLTVEDLDGALLRRVIEQAVASFGEPARIVIDGPDVRLAPRTAVSLAIAMHELYSNACRHGSLSVAGGRVNVGWRIAGGEGPRLQLHWRESGGPAVAVPAHRGFGSRMLERGLARELAGTVQLHFVTAGLDCRIDAPLPVVPLRTGP